MRKQRKDAQHTRQRLLAAAAEVFAKKGFWEATHAEICRRAGANTAAVNYHFGSKENLYIEAWKHAFARSIQAHPPDGGVAPDAPVEQRLHGRILAFMHRIADPDNHEVEIMHKEMANPTGLLSETIHQTVQPMRRDMFKTLQELLGNGASEQQGRFCEMSIVGQCFGPMLHLRRARMGLGGPRPPGLPSKFAVEELADHVTQFSLAGIRAIRDGARTRRRAGRQRRTNRTASKQE